MNLNPESGVKREREGELRRRHSLMDARLLAMRRRAHTTRTPGVRSLMSFEKPAVANSFDGTNEQYAFPPRVPAVLARNPHLRRAYQINHEWKSVTIKIAISVYMLVVAYMFAIECHPWYTYFKYLTIWGWTLVQLYFLYTLYLDLMGRWNGPEGVSEVATVFAQALSELAFAVQVVVTAFFWFCIYPQEPWRFIGWEINMHGVGLTLMIFDYLYRFAGFQLRNLKFVYAFAGFYTTIHLFSVWASGEPIYPGMDFTNVYSFVIFLSGLTTVVLTHKVFYLIHNWSRLREEWKTVVGISAFFLIPRKDSIEILMGPDDWTTNEREGASAMSSLEPRLSHSHSFSSAPSPRSAEAYAASEQLPRGLARRLHKFALNEVLSVSPSVQARSHARGFISSDH
eukprot:Gregarina_sp_Poly_1__1287@NODE_1314_length_4412_cov_268_398849_g888_i0_p2_GENE_NODE_1314_length_4412_cov_268_398849_g888_i0NODE_1314_length_4412_cov_268_398849_g888_i0_p2_ORF_typecomplete_len398_score33_64Far17a_AIG1/PF04750_14/5_3e02Far17a_AIG1/PF04750_14/8_7e10_NODE_1314_length_4412_cov_268_398849_g888_i01201313